MVQPSPPRLNTASSSYQDEDEDDMDEDQEMEDTPTKAVHDTHPYQNLHSLATSPPLTGTQFVLPLVAFPCFPSVQERCLATLSLPKIAHADSETIGSPQHVVILRLFCSHTPIACLWPKPFLLWLLAFRIHVPIHPTQ